MMAESLKRSRAYLEALSAVVAITTTELISTVQGGTPELQGTWVHPKVAINIAAWISPEFEVWAFAVCHRAWLHGVGRGKAVGIKRS